MTKQQAHTNNSLRDWLWGPLSSVGYIWAAIAFVLDQAHKTWMLNVTGITTADRISVTPFLDIILIWNKGISYGLFQQEGMAGKLALAGFALLATIALALWLSRPEQTKMNAVAIGLIMGGALGNGLDRLIRPGVADFFSLHAFGFNWYIFNVADIAIVAGVAGLLYDALFISPKTASKSSQD